jgi:poly(beta-D-mannuronate) lyase
MTVEPGVGTLRKAVSKSSKGDTLKLKAGVYSFDKSVRISNDIVIVGDENGGTIVNLAENIEKDFNYLIRINQGNSLHIKNITFNGGNSNVLKYGITSPSKMENEPYQFKAENCNFINFTNPDSGSAFRTYRGTLATKLEFKNCKFIDAYRGINIDRDKDNIGSFSALEVIVENSVFKNIEEYAISYKRNTISVDIEGGNLHVKNSIFENVFNTEDGRVIRSDGLYAVKIENTAFIDSYLIKKSLRLKGENNIIKNCLFYAIGFPEARDGAQQEDIISKNPKWEDKDNYIPSKKSPLLKSENGIEAIGLID